MPVRHRLRGRRRRRVLPPGPRSDGFAADIGAVSDRVTSEFWVAAYLRRVRIEGAFAVLRRRGAPEAGAIAVVVVRGDRLAALFLQAPQSAFDTARPGDRLFVPAYPDVFVEERRVDAKLAREIDFDPDLWIVDVEDRDGRSFLDLAGPSG